MILTPRPEEPLVGPAHVHEVLWSSRRFLHGHARGAPETAAVVEPAPGAPWT